MKKIFVIFLSYDATDECGTNVLWIINKIKYYLDLLKKMFVGWLSFNKLSASMADVSNFTKCVSLNNRPCMTILIINSNPDEYNQGLR